MTYQQKYYVLIYRILIIQNIKIKSYNNMLDAK